MNELKQERAIFQENLARLHAYQIHSYASMAAIGEYLPYSPVDVSAKVYVELGERDFEERDDKTMPLADLLAELNAFAAKAPKGADVVIEFGASGYDGEEYATYEVGYFRDPTDAEKAEREETNRKIAERNQKRAAEAADEERAEFERLKEKFG